MGSERRNLRCAIYTRKSSEHGLEQDFNSLHAQRESAEAYIKSQAHEGTEAVNKFSEMSDQSVGDTAALAELIEAAFSPKTSPSTRLIVVRELSHLLQTKWKRSKASPSPPVTNFSRNRLSRRLIARIS